MIELPEALIIARQMTQELKGRRIASAIRGNSPHKFAFYSQPPEGYQALLTGKTVGESKGHGSAILTFIEGDYHVVLGGGGERILFHEDEKALPKKHQLLLHFEDGAYLTVTVSGWGNVMLLHKSELAGHPHVGEPRVSPVTQAFTFEYLQGLFEELEGEDPRSIKYFVISKPGIWGIGNGYLQDILFRAKLHPRTRAVDIPVSKRRDLHRAIKHTLKQAVDLGGRDSERDLYNRPGGYSRILDSRTVGRPCPECGTPIEKIRYLGGASYFCPSCQVL
ncbi:MAG: zinc finger domain-containing protein [Anaerolineales bacterium]|jgi:formamidopyrimidine-DNA glycosylase